MHGPGQARRAAGAYIGIRVLPASERRGGNCMTEPKARIAVQVQLEIPFQDCDPMGVTWHGNYFRYLEVARSALLDRIDYNYRQMHASGYAWPIVDARLKYLRSTRFGDRVSVSATLVEHENRLKIEYLISNLATGEPVTRGYTIQVAVNLAKEEMCFCSPPELIDRVLACSV